MPSSFIHPSGKSQFAYKATVIILNLCCLGGYAAPSPAAGDNLGEIIVTGRQPVVSEISTVHRVDAGEIELRDDRNLGDVMELIPGVNVRVGGQAVPRIDIRGLRTRHVKLLVNGIVFNSTFDGQFDPTLFPAEQLEQVKVTTGGVSELYGSGAMAVINILTPSSADNALKVLAEMGLGGDSRFAFSSGGSQGPLNYYLSASRQDRKGFELSGDFVPTSIEDGGLRDNSDRKRNNVFGNISYSPSDNLQLGLIVSGLTGEYGLPPAVVNDPADIFASRPSYERVENQNGIAAQTSFDYDSHNHWFARGWGYGNRLSEDENRYDDATYSSIDDVSQSGNYLTTVETLVAGLGLQAGYHFNERARLTLGLDYHRDNWQQDGVIRDVAVGGGGGSPRPVASCPYGSPGPG